MSDWLILNAWYLYNQLLALSCVSLRVFSTERAVADCMVAPRATATALGVGSFLSARLATAKRPTQTTNARNKSSAAGRDALQNKSAVRAQQHMAFGAVWDLCDRREQRLLKWYAFRMAFRNARGSQFFSTPSFFQCIRY